MKISHFIESKVLLVEFSEEIDHHAGEMLRKRIDYEIQRFMPRKLVFDFSNVNFMDSAGIGLLIGRYKSVKLYGGQAVIMNVNPKIKMILEMAGVPKIMEIVNHDDENNYEKI